MEFEILEPIGYCRGVQKAIQIALDAKQKNSDKDIVILGQLVHNIETIEFLRKNGINVFELDVEQIIPFLEVFKNKHTIYILSAHGHSLEIEEYLIKNNLNFIDATCPILKKINSNFKELDLKGKALFYYGKENHNECKATISYINTDDLTIIPKKDRYFNFSNINKKIVLTNQSTIDLKDIKDCLVKDKDEKEYEIIDNFCPVFKQRFDLIDKYINQFDMFLIIGDKNSSNANELVSAARNKFKDAYLISSIYDIDEIKNFENHKKVAILSATSTSEDKVNNIFEFLNNNW